MPFAFPLVFWEMGYENAEYRNPCTLFGGGTQSLHGKRHACRAEKYFPEAFGYRIFAPKSHHSGNAGINLAIDKRIDLEVSRLTEMENIGFAAEE